MCLLYVKVLSSLPLSITHLIVKLYVFFVIKLVINCVRLDSESSFTTYNCPYFKDLKRALKGAICIYETVIITLFLDVSVILCLQIF